MMNIFSNNQQETKKITTKEELSQYFFSEIHNDGLSEEDKEKMQARIMQKLKSGKKLTTEEMNFLKKYNPVMYIHAMRVQKKAEMVEEQLKHAKSKEEANRIISSAISGISDKDPDKEYIIAAVNRVSEDFHKSGAYSRLPNTEEDAKKCKERKTMNTPGDDEEEDGESEVDLLQWSPLKEVIAAMPTFTAEA